MPEIGLGIGRERGTYQGMTREWLFWYDEDGNRYATPEEVKLEKERYLQEILTKLQQRGIDLNTL
jgi:hypothetical protein